MSLDHQKHVEAHALLTLVVKDCGHCIPYRAAIESWLERNPPAAEATPAFDDLTLGPCGKLFEDDGIYRRCTQRAGHPGVHHAAYAYERVIA